MRKISNTKKARSRHYEAKAGKTQKETASALDELAVYEEFKASFVPLLRKMIREGVPIDKIRKAFAPAVQANMIQQALKGDYKAMKDTLDRFEGSPVQRVNQTTLHANMDIEELRALVAQRANDTGLASIIEAKFKKVENEEPTED
jgi:predicted glycosyl hydrolase (DUF1957 family)